MQSYRSVEFYVSADELVKALLDFLNYYKDAIDSLQSIGTIIAIAIGGVWTYRLFIQKRTKFPKVEITHAVTHRILTAEKNLIRVSMNITNKGEAMLPVRYGFVWIQQVKPVPDWVLEKISNNEDPISFNQYEVS